MQSIFILYDHSHIWGLMAYKSLSQLGFLCRLIKAQDIAEADILSKHTPKLLIVPGGNAKLKSMALGDKGKYNILKYVRSGGNYLGFCGGAGLALNHEDGIGLCPWTRKSYPERLQHLISGHVIVKVHEHRFSPKSFHNKTISLPVWWPGKFSNNKGDIKILASSIKPDKDLWLADFPLGKTDKSILETWKYLYGIDLSDAFLNNAPLIISGELEKGNYILSYSHLETPMSKKANIWLCDIIKKTTKIKCNNKTIPIWDTNKINVAWLGKEGKILEKIAYDMQNLLQLACDNHLFIKRSTWLWGWKQAMPGSMLNNLNVAINILISKQANEKALAQFKKDKELLLNLWQLFIESARAYFLAYCLSETMQHTDPNIVDKKILSQQSKVIFGKAMHGGGLVSEILGILEELIYLNQD